MIWVHKGTETGIHPFLLPLNLCHDTLRAECKISGFRQNAAEAFTFLRRYAV